MAGVSWGMTHNPTDDSLRPFRQSVEGTWEPGTGSERHRTRGEDGTLGQWKEVEIYDLEFSLEIRAKGSKYSEAQRSKQKLRQ